MNSTLEDLQRIFKELDPPQHRHFIVTKRGFDQIESLLRTYPESRHLFHVQQVPEDEPMDCDIYEINMEKLHHTKPYDNNLIYKMIMYSKLTVC